MGSGYRRDLGAELSGRPVGGPDTPVCARAGRRGRQPRHVPCLLDRSEQRVLLRCVTDRAPTERHPTVSARRSSHSISRHSRRGGRRFSDSASTRRRTNCGPMRCMAVRLSCLAIEPGAGRRAGSSGRMDMARAELRAQRARLAGRCRSRGGSPDGPGPGRICVGRACRRAGHSGASAGRSKRRHSSQGKVRHNEITCDVSCRHRCNCAHRGRQSASPDLPPHRRRASSTSTAPGSARTTRSLPTGTNCPTPPPSCGRTAPIFTSSAWPMTRIRGTTASPARRPVRAFRRCSTMATPTRAF